MLSPTFFMKAKMLFLSVGLKVISGLLFVPLVTGGNLLTKPPPPKEDVSVSMFPTVDLMTFCKKRSEQKFNYELKEGIRA